MGERIAFASWDYISLVCSEHGNELVLDVAKGNRSINVERRTVP